MRLCLCGPPSSLSESLVREGKWGDLLVTREGLMQVLASELFDIIISILSKFVLLNAPLF